jgi:hypothetical protein
MLRHLCLIAFGVALIATAPTVSAESETLKSEKLRLCYSGGSSACDTSSSLFFPGKGSVALAFRGVDADADEKRIEFTIEITNKTDCTAYLPGVSVGTRTFSGLKDVMEVSWGGASVAPGERVKSEVRSYRMRESKSYELNHIELSWMVSLKDCT